MQPLIGIWATYFDMNILRLAWIFCYQCSQQPLKCLKFRSSSGHDFDGNNDHHQCRHHYPDHNNDDWWSWHWHTIKKDAWNRKYNKHKLCTYQPFFFFLDPGIVMLISTFFLLGDCCGCEFAALLSDLSSVSRRWSATWASKVKGPLLSQGLFFFLAFQLPWLFPIFQDLKITCHCRHLSKSSLFRDIFWNNLPVFNFVLTSTSAIM